MQVIAPDNALQFQTVQVAHLTAAIGGNVRAARNARGWTLDDLAARASLSRRSLVQIEQGRSNPTVASLLALSDALGIGLPRLMAVPESPTLHVVRAGGAPTLWQGPGGGHAQLLAGTGPPNVVEFWDWRLGPGDRYSSEAHPVGTWELLQVQQGSVRLEVGDDAQTLGPSDTASFAGSQPHAYAWSDPDGPAGPADGLARFTLVVLQPDVGA